MLVAGVVLVRCDKGSRKDMELRVDSNGSCDVFAVACTMLTLHVDGGWIEVVCNG